MNLPNKITLARIAIIPVFVLFFFLDFEYHFFFATIFFALAAFTDFLDGYIARKNNMVTDLGKFLDPIADKVLVLTALVLMLTDYSGVSGYMNNILPSPISRGYSHSFSILPAVFGGIGISIIIAREMIVASFRMVAASKNVVIAADKLGKIKTVSQDIAILLLLFSQSFDGDFFDFIYITGFWVFVFSVIMTILSGINYIWQNRVVFAEAKACDDKLNESGADNKAEEVAEDNNENKGEEFEKTEDVADSNNAEEVAEDNIEDKDEIISDKDINISDKNINSASEIDKTEDLSDENN